MSFTTFDKPSMGLKHKASSGPHETKSMQSFADKGSYGDAPSVDSQKSTESSEREKKGDNAMMRRMVLMSMGRME